MRTSSPTPEQLRQTAGAGGRAPRPGARRDRGAGGAGAGRAGAARACSRRLRWRRSAPTTTTRARRTRSASPTRMSSTAFAGASSTRRTSSRAPRDERDVERCWSGARPSAWRRSRSAAARRSSAASRADVPGAYNGAIAIDLRALDRVLEVDAVSRSARIQGGATGPRLEAQLGEHGLTLRHFPQSFEYSTLGGWIATRAAGHFATVYDAHRGLRRVRARDHAGRRVAVAQAARLGRRRQPRPHARRLGGHARA